MDIWTDRKHFMWFPWTFTVYKIENNRLYEKKGLFSTKYEETLLYRIIDISLSRSFSQKIFGTGTITITTRSDTESTIYISNVKDCENLKNLISELVEESRERKRIAGKEIYGSNINIEGDF